MISFIETLQRIYGKKQVYPVDQIISAYNCFCQKQVIDVNNTDSTYKNELKKQGYYEVILKTHKWHGKLVRTGMRPNKDNIVIIYFGSKVDHIHKKFLK